LISTAASHISLIEIATNILNYAFLIISVQSHRSVTLSFEGRGNIRVHLHVRVILFRENSGRCGVMFLLTFERCR